MILGSDPENQTPNAKRSARIRPLKPEEPRQQTLPPVFQNDLMRESTLFLVVLTLLLGMVVILRLSF